jgi:hypothetical protein
MDSDLGRVHKMDSDIGRVHKMDSDIGRVHKMDSAIGRVHKTDSDIGRVHKMDSDIGRVHKMDSDIEGGVIPKTAKSEAPLNMLKFIVQASANVKGGSCPYLRHAHVQNRYTC